MKKAFLFAALAALSMVSCTNNELPEADPGYGYINVNVSNDPVVETRAIQTVDINQWWVKLGEIRLTTARNMVKAGTYTLSAASHETETAWMSDNSNFGSAYYSAVPQTIVLSAGETEDVSFSCGKAKNACIKVQFSLAPSFTNYSLTINRSVGENTHALVFDKTNALATSETPALAFFEASPIDAEGNTIEASKKVINYTLTYTHNTKGTNTIEGSIEMGGPATMNVISVSSNDNGTISVTVNYDDTFGTGNSENLEFDAATGESTSN